LLNKLFSKDNKPLDRVDTHWMSETGIIDTFFLPGPTPTDVFDQYKYLTGGQFMPPMFSLGYHQCRWNYRDEDDVSQVNAGFEEHNIPMDVMWLDIEHTDQKKYFTWDNRHFPTPEDMQKSLESYGRKMVTIVDPHIKRDKGYYVHDEATEKGYYVKNNNGETDYEGWCWPGSSSWLDFLREDVRDYWADQFKLDKYKGSTANLYTWNDMNEPSVFNGPEVSMHRDAKHMHGKVEHRDVHNQYGFYMTMGTHEGHLRRSNGLSRPFVLTRAFYSGSQRYASVWTGDNTATWAHLKASLPMIMSLNIAGISFSGADVGGFFGNPDAELLTRWYQTAAFTPFFREHGHIDTKRREPWLFGQPYLDVIREAIRLRYQLLPYWYTLFEGAHSKLHPIVRPMFVEFPADAQTFSMEDQMMVGSALLVKPVTDAGATTIDVYLPHGTWYEWKTQKAYQGQGATITLRTPLEYIPIFVRGGSIVPLKERSRRSTHQMVNDPYTLIVALDDKKAASGELYIDDGESFNYEKGASIRRGFTYTTAEDGTSAHLVSAALSDNKMYLRNKIEKIVVLGVAKAPSSININGQALTFEHDSNKGKLVIRKPDVLVSQGWDVQIQF
jgi:alpha 1,3-glucosidase